MASKYVYDYYKVSVPGDVFQGGTMPEDEQKRRLCNCAIDEAREKARLYCIPCEWTAEILRGEVGSWEVVVSVRRKRNRK